MRGFAILAECWDLTSHCYLLLDSFLYAIASFGHYTHCLFLENIIKYMVSCKPFDNSWRKKQYFSEFFPKSWEHRLRISAVNPSRTGSRDGDDFVSKPASPNKPFVARELRIPSSPARVHITSYINKLSATVSTSSIQRLSFLSIPVYCVVQLKGKLDPRKSKLAVRSGRGRFNPKRSYLLLKA